MCLSVLKTITVTEEHVKIYFTYTPIASKFFLVFSKGTKVGNRKTSQKEL